MKNKKLLFASSTVVLLVLFAFAAKFYKNYRMDFLANESSSLFVKDYSPRFGSKDARVFLTEFLDPECESCRVFYPMVKSLLEEFPGKVQLIVRYAPFHKNSIMVVKALEASRKQGKYWESLEILFKQQPNWGDHHNPQPNLIFDYLQDLGIDIVKLKSDMEDPKIEEMIAQETADLKKLNIRGTPTFFVNGKPLEKFGLDYLREAIKAEVDIEYN